MESDKGADAGTQGTQRYRFGDIVVDAVAHTILRDGRPVSLEPKVYSVLLELLRRPGQMVPRDELLDTVWGHRHVTPGVLTRAITQLRAGLADDPQRPHYIQTQHALGYRFIGVLEPEAVSVPVLDAAGETGQAAVAASAGPVVATTSSEPIQAIGEDAVEESAIDLAGPGGKTALPYAGDERRNQDFRRWPWWLAAGLLLVLACWLWLDRRGIAGSRPEPSIAVLPFANLGGSRDDDYFAEGLAVEMHDALAGIKNLKVAAPISRVAVARGGNDAKVLGALLGVATVLDATVRREGKRVRINARLTDCATGFTLWSRTYDRELADVFDTQVEIANEVVQSLLGSLPRQDGAIARRLAPTRNAAAFDAYLRGLEQLLQPARQQGSRSAVHFFNQALSEDSRFSRAQAGICRAEVADFADRHDAGAFDRASASCARALAMDPALAEVNLALGELHHAKGEYGKAVEYYARAESDPSSRPAAWVGIAIAHSEQGRDAQALAYFDRALALRPGDGHIHAQIGYQHFLAGRMHEAIASYRKAVLLRPDDSLLWGYLGGVYLTAGDVPEAERALARSIAIEPSYAALTNLGELKYLSGEHAEAVRLQQQALELDASDHTTWGNLAQAQLASPGTAAQSRTAFAEAADRAQRYVAIKPDDAKAVAALGWYLANLGKSVQARQLIVRSEALGGEPGEVALYNAQTFASLGEPERARARIAAARAAGIVAHRIEGNAALGRALAPATDMPGKPPRAATNRNQGSSAGE